MFDTSCFGSFYLQMHIATGKKAVVVCEHGQGGRTVVSKVQDCKHVSNYTEIPEPGSRQATGGSERQASLRFRQSLWLSVVPVALGGTCGSRQSARYAKSAQCLQMYHSRITGGNNY